MAMQVRWWFGAGVSVPMQSKQERGLLFQGATLFCMDVGLWGRTKDLPILTTPCFLLLLLFQILNSPVDCDLPFHPPKSLDVEGPPGLIQNVKHGFQNLTKKLMASSWFWFQSCRHEILPPRSALWTLELHFPHLNWLASSCPQRFAKKWRMEERKVYF